MIIECFACETEYEKRQIEHHHYPVPKRNEGKLTIPLCRTCHDFIDRYTLERWPIAQVLGAIENLDTDSKLFMLKLLSRIVPDGISFESEIAEGAK